MLNHHPQHDLFKVTCGRGMGAERVEKGRGRHTGIDLSTEWDKWIVFCPHLPFFYYRTFTLI